VKTITLLAAILGGAVSAWSCATSYGTATEPTPAAAADAGLAPVTDAGAVGDGEAPPDAQANTAIRCPPNALLCDTFEDRSGSTTDLVGTRWEMLAGAAAGRIDDAMSYSPSHSLAFDVPVGTSGKTLGLQARPTISATRVALRAALRVSALPPYAQLLSMVADSSLFALVVNGGKLVVQHPNGSNLFTYNVTPADAPVDRWFRVALVVDFGSSGGVELLIDDVPVYKAAAATTSAATISSFHLIVDPDFGNAGTATSQPITLHYDDIILE
jgi:hypothetical protein